MSYISGVMNDSSSSSSHMNINAIKAIAQARKAKQAEYDACLAKAYETHDNATWEALKAKAESLKG